MASVNENIDNEEVDQPLHPSRGNKASKKNKKKNKNQDWEDESEGIIYVGLSNGKDGIMFNLHLTLTTLHVVFVFYLYLVIRLFSKCVF